MIVVSEDGCRAVPFKEYAFTIENLSYMELNEFSEYEMNLMRQNKTYLLTACKDPDGSYMIMGAYSSMEKAKEMLAALLHCYSTQGEGFIARLKPEIEGNNNNKLILF